MTIARTIAIAEQHAARGDVEAACRILTTAHRAALSNSAKDKLELAKARILHAAVDATVARSQTRGA